MSKLIEQSCPLCLLERRTKVIHEDAVCVVLDCETCHVPMIVLKRHAAKPAPDECVHMLGVVEQLGLVVVRSVPRKIPGHAHWHLGKSGG